MIPVAMTRAKYPGKRSAAVLRTTFLSGAELVIEWTRLFFAPLAVEFKPDSRIATLFGKNPVAPDQGRVVAYVLAVAAIQDRAPMILVVFFEPGNLPFHLCSLQR